MDGARLTFGKMAWLLRGGQTCKQQEGGRALGRPGSHSRPEAWAERPQMRERQGASGQDLGSWVFWKKSVSQGGRGAGVRGDGTGFESWLPHVQVARPEAAASGLGACLLVCDIPVRSDPAAKSTRTSSPTPLPTPQGPKATLAAAPAPRASPIFHALQSGPPPAGPAGRRSHMCESHFEAGQRGPRLLPGVSPPGGRMAGTVWRHRDGAMARLCGCVFA